jgi:hypothetical protein
MATTRLAEKGPISGADIYLGWTTLSQNTLFFQPAPTSYEPTHLNNEDLHVFNPAILQGSTDDNPDLDTLQTQNVALNRAFASDLTSNGPNIIATGLFRSSNRSPSTILPSTKSETINAKKTRDSSKCCSKSKTFDKNDSRRERYLAHNRRAAGKCRRRKKARNQQLEDLYRKQSAEQESLLLERDCMRCELLELKDELLKHARCNDPALSLDLARMAGKAGEAVAPVARSMSHSLPSYSRTCMVKSAVNGIY